MTSTLRRAGGFAAVGTLALAAPELGRAAAAPFAVVALLAAFVVDEGPVFELFARPQDRRDGRLNGLAGFALAATGLAVLATAPRESMPTPVFAATVLVVAYGNVGARAVENGCGATPADRSPVSASPRSSPLSPASSSSGGTSDAPPGRRRPSSSPPPVRSWQRSCGRCSTNATTPS